MRLVARLLRREDLHSLAAPYALDALDTAERRRFDKHLASCARCRAETRVLSEDAVRLAWSTPVAPPAALRDRVFAAVRATPQDPAPAAAPGHATPLPPHVWGNRPPPSHTRPRRRRPLLAPLATATALAALAAASLLAVQAHRDAGRLAAEQARAREIAHVLAAPDARVTGGKDARGRGLAVVASAAERGAVVTLSGYGTPPGGRVRQLWLVRPHAQPRSLGLLAGDTPLVATGLDKSATSLAVTIEPEGGSKRPTGLPVVQLTLKSVGFGE